MDRRTFLLLTGAGSTAVFGSPRHVATRPSGAGRLRFELDEGRRWSLWYLAEGPPVPLIRNAALGAWIADQFLTLGDLEYSTVGSRRPPGGDAVVVRGRAGGVYLEAELLAGPLAAAPLATVSLTIYPDRDLPSIKGVRFFQAPCPEVMPGAGELIALVNGSHSSAGARLMALPPLADSLALTSHAALGLTRDGRGLALAFDPDDPGEGKVKLSTAGLDALSDWAHARPVRPNGDTSRLQLCYQPDGDGVEALRALFVPTSLVDQQRLAGTPAPTGWSSGRALRASLSEADVINHADFCAGHFDPRFFRLIELGEGYQRAAGDWDTNARFSHGHRWLTDQIHSRRFQAGLWLAPFGVSERSGIPAAHPDWLVRTVEDDTPSVLATREDWGGRVYALDGAHPAVRQWLFDLARRVVQEWGYDYVRLDRLRWATSGGSHYGGLTPAEACRLGLHALRDGAGSETFLLGGDAPLQHSVGFVNGMRIGPDGDTGWGEIQAPARAAALRSFYHRGVWLNDPDTLTVGPPLSLAEARLWTSIVAVSGDITVLSDDLIKLDPERLALLARALPAAPSPGRPIGAARDEPELAPALTASDDVYRIPGPWKFRTGDDPGYATREYDETAWEAIPIPAPWEQAGHPAYAGYAWYRVRVTLPPSPPGRSAYLELGKVAEVDEAFVNGVSVGQTGAFPPGFRGEPDAFRRYRVPSDALNWGGENVLAVRVYEGGGGSRGGLWSVRRDRPANVWIAEGGPRWWTVVLANWEDEATQHSVPLTALGLTGARFTAYDVWRTAPLPDLTDALTATLDPHSCITVAIRPAAARPQVIGTTRHIVQGAVDIVDEAWDAVTRTLRARSTNLDGRAYGVTIAVPSGMRPATCKADVPCSVRRLESGHAVLEWAAGGDGGDVGWEITFRRVGAPGKD
jgi:melibiase-like protein